MNLSDRRYLSPLPDADWTLSAAELVAVTLSIALAHVPGWSGATDDQLDCVARAIVTALDEQLQEAPPIQHEAAVRIAELDTALRDLVDVLHLNDRADDMDLAANLGFSDSQHATLFKVIDAARAALKQEPPPGGGCSG